MRRVGVSRRHAGAVGLHHEREDLRSGEGHGDEECSRCEAVRTRPAEAEQHPEERLVADGGEDVQLQVDFIRSVRPVLQGFQHHLYGNRLACLFQSRVNKQRNSESALP